MAKSTLITALNGRSTSLLKGTKATHDSGAASRRFIYRLVMSVVTCFMFWAPQLHGAGNETAAASAEPVLISSFAWGGDASKCGLRIGDLNGDGVADILMARQIGGGHQVPCLVLRLTAYDLQGNQLWQVGDPAGGKYRHFSDVPVQVADIDGDGALEVIVVMSGDDGKEIQIRDGASGRIEKAAPIPHDHAHDAIVLADLDGIGRRANVILKDRYKNLWALNADLSLRFQFSGNLGHFVRPFDIDNDGADELLAGFQCLEGDGKVAWNLRVEDGEPLRSRAHADAIWVADVDGVAANGHEIAMADESKSGLLFNADGTLRWRFRPPEGKNILSHSQHAVVGELRPDSSGLETVFYSRDTRHVVLVSAKGELLAERGEFSRIAIIDLVPNWDGSGKDHILVFRDGNKGPILLNGALETVIGFPRNAPGLDDKGEFFVVISEICGDEADELVIYDEAGVAVYSHRPADPAKRRTGKQRPQTGTDASWTCYIGGVTK